MELVNGELGKMSIKVAAAMDMVEKVMVDDQVDTIGMVIEEMEYGVMYLRAMELMVMELIHMEIIVAEL